MEEVFDIFTRDGKHIGTEKESVCHSENPGVYHKPIWIWIINSKNEFLLQKRSSKMKRFPNKWGMPSAGHVKAGETILQGAMKTLFFQANSQILILNLKCSQLITLKNI